MMGSNVYHVAYRYWQQEVQFQMLKFKIATFERLFFWLTTGSCVLLFVLPSYEALVLSAPYEDIEGAWESIFLFTEPELFLPIASFVLVWVVLAFNIHKVLKAILSVVGLLISGLISVYAFLLLHFPIQDVVLSYGTLVAFVLCPLYVVHRILFWTQGSQPLLSKDKRNGKMISNRPRSNILCCITTLFLLFVVAASLQGQTVEHSRPWTLGAGVAFYDLASASGVGVGPSVIVNRRIGKLFGVEFTPTYIVQADGFRTFQGLAGDIGIFASWRQSYTEFIVGSGVSALTGVDGSGGGLGRGGVYVSGQGNLWFTNQVGLYGRLIARLWLIGHISEEEYGRGGPSASGGVVVRF